MTTVNGAGNLGTNVKVTLYVRDDIPGTNDQASKTPGTKR